ncbi:MAG TPA: stage V sporulation protein AE [Candidatus Pullichristensenella avicola]|nr:stage V sporulation protein AE [Candidatus Pullichristensenella avicola]
MEILWDFVKAFAVGGLICALGQVLIQTTKLTNARILVLFVTAGVFLTAVGVYKPLVDFAGAGATVPLTGFGYSLAMGAIEAVNRYGLIGALSGGVTRAAAGIAAAVFFGLVNALIFKPHAKP